MRNFQRIQSFLKILTILAMASFWTACSQPISEGIIEVEGVSQSSRTDYEQTPEIHPESTQTAAQGEQIPETLDWSFWFPGGVKRIDGTPVSYSELEGKMVGIYFSAHWCPPCRQFTPALVDFYEKHKANMEIVFVSGDRSPAQKQLYIKEDKMSWLTIDFQGEDSDRLMSGLGVQGLPTLVILNDSARIITMEGYRELSSAPGEVWGMWNQYMTSPEES
ncbi:MAG: thioredoxin-like domain-containing protein [Verrucomicrobiota bacterium]